MDHNLSNSAPPSVATTVTERYNEFCTRKCADANWRKLKALVRLLGLTPTQVAREAGVSRPYASRLLNEHDPLEGSATFYRRLESNLGRLVDSRSAGFFAVDVVPLDDTTD